MPKAKPKPRKRIVLELEPPLFEAPEEEASEDKESSERSPEPAVTLRNVVRLELLEQADPQLLRRFLRRYESHLQGRGIHLDGISPNPAWLDVLHGVLQRVDLDPRLQQDLIDLGELASEEGHQQALRTIFRAQLSLFDRDLHLRTVDTALHLFLEHPGLFRRIQTSLQTTQARDSVIFCARKNAPLLDFQPKGRRLRDAERRLSAFFASKNCTGFCEIKVVEQDDHVGFVIIHGSPPKTYGIVLNRNERSRTSNVQEVQDSVLFHKDTCQLSVQAGQAEVRDAYRGVFGSIFFGSQHHFQIKSVVSLDPLLTLGPQAFHTEHFLGLRSVKLRQLQVVERGGRGSRWSVEAPDLASRLENQDLQQLMSRGTLQMARMDVHLYGQRRVVPVRLIPPGTFKHDRRTGLDQVQSFLLFRGFLLREPMPVVSTVEGVH
jgi:hypothetical protein